MTCPCLVSVIPADTEFGIAKSRFTRERLENTARTTACLCYYVHSIQNCAQPHLIPTLQTATKQRALNHSALLNIHPVHTAVTFSSARYRVYDRPHLHISSQRRAVSRCLFCYIPLTFVVASLQYIHHTSLYCALILNADGTDVTMAYVKQSV
jgi:hypothetical protein